jgi:hypothetical protein
MSRHLDLGTGTQAGCVDHDNDAHQANRRSAVGSDPTWTAALGLCNDQSPHFRQTPARASRAGLYCHCGAGPSRPDRARFGTSNRGSRRAPERRRRHVAKRHWQVVPDPKGTTYSQTGHVNPREANKKQSGMGPRRRGRCQAPLRVASRRRGMTGATRRCLAVPCAQIGSASGV